MVRIRAVTTEAATAVFVADIKVGLGEVFAAVTRVDFKVDFVAAIKVDSAADTKADFGVVIREVAIAAKSARA